jgi:hypothetical protein
LSFDATDDSYDEFVTAELAKDDDDDDDELVVIDPVEDEFTEQIEDEDERLSDECEFGVVVRGERDLKPAR